MPERRRSDTDGSYFETLCHELCHWTEHFSSLNWDRPEKENIYALGELVAELGACYLMDDVGLPLADIRYRLVGAEAADGELVLRRPGVDLVVPLAPPVRERASRCRWPASWK